jgi:hypothetical protein
MHLFNSNEIQDLASQLEEGKTVMFPAFTSSSKTEMESFPGDIQMVIHSKHGKEVERFSVQPAENEVLFRSSTKFKVLKETKTPCDKMHPSEVCNLDVELEEVDE